MNYEFRSLPVFEKELKRLTKKYKSLKQDVLTLQKDLEKEPDLGVDIGHGFKKIRLAISSKGKDKRGGARVITKNIIIRKSHLVITFVFLWDKSEMENVDMRILRRFVE